MNDDNQVNENQREEIKDEIFRKEQDIEEEISQLKTELKGYKKAIHQMDRAGRGWFRFWMIPLAILLLIGGFVGFLFISQFVKYYNFAKEGIPLNILTQSSNQLTETPGVAGSSSSTSLIAAAKLATADDPAKGKDDAKITLIEFSDFQCPFCKESYTVIKQLLARYPDDIKLIYRDFPVDSIHSFARKAAEAGECANEQGKFWEYHDKIFENQEALNNEDGQIFYKIAKDVGLDEKLFTTCFGFGKYKQEVEEDYQAGVSAGLRGTPTWFFNGQKVEGSLSLETFEKIIQELLK